MIGRGIWPASRLVRLRQGFRRRQAYGGQVGGWISFRTGKISSARGVEPTEAKREPAESHAEQRNSKVVDPRSSPRNPVQTGEDVAKVVLAWAKLPQSIREAILALVEASNGGGL